jgi:hypothetical protein
MIDERSLQDLRSSFERDWLKHATDKELALLELSAARPELFEKTGEDAGSLFVLVDPSVAPEGRLTVVDSTPQVAENAAALVFNRTRLRARFGLPQNDCAQPPRYGQGTCTCLTRVLDSLGNEALDREGVLKAARKLHKRSIPRPRVRKRTPAAKAEPSPTAVAPPLEKLTQTSTKPALKPQLRTERGEPHPLSYAAFKRDKGDPRFEESSIASLKPKEKRGSTHVRQRSCSFGSNRPHHQGT